MDGRRELGEKRKGDEWEKEGGRVLTELVNSVPHCLLLGCHSVVILQLPPLWRSPWQPCGSTGTHGSSGWPDTTVHGYKCFCLFLPELSHRRLLKEGVCEYSCNLYPQYIH